MRQIALKEEVWRYMGFKSMPSANGFVDPCIVKIFLMNLEKERFAEKKERIEKAYNAHSSIVYQFQQQSEYEDKFAVIK